MEERRKRRLVAQWAMIVSLLVGAFAFAEEAVVLPVAINEVARGEAFVLIEDSGDIWMEVEAFVARGVAIAQRGARRAHQGRNLVSLRSLAPDVTFALDDASLELRLTVDPSLLALQRFTRGRSRPENLERLAGRGGFLNYRATFAAFEDVSAFVDGGWSVKGLLAYSSAVLGTDGDLRRGTTSLMLDQPEAMRRFTFGDAFARSDQLGGSLFLAGVTVAREFLLDPYFVRFPSLNLAGAVSTPSTVEVYLNGSLVDRRELPPGRFEIDQLSLPAGRGAATVLVRDAFGGERMIVEPFYSSPIALEEGLSEYSYSVGFRRENETTESFDYGEPAALASHRWGVTKTFTAGYRAEATEGLWSAGGTIAARSLLGEVSIQAGMSADDGESGSAVQARYAYLTRAHAVTVAWTEMSDRYATVSLPSESDRATRRFDFLATLRRGRFDVGLSGSLEERRDFASTDRIALSGSYPVLARGTLFVSAGVAETAGERAPEVGVGLTWNLGFLRSASLRADHRNDQSSFGISAQQNLAREPGWGYRVDAGMNDDDDTSSVRVQRQTRNFLFEVDANPSMSSDAVNVSAAGGLAFGDGRAHLMRPAQQSYAIVRVPGVEGVRVYVSNLEAGRTNANGELIVTDLIPYYGNRIRIEDSDVPVHYRIDRIERVIAPPLRGGVIVEFTVTPTASITGTAVIQQADGSTRIPATGEMRLASAKGKVDVSPLGRAGEFYFEGLVPGLYSVEMIDEAGICRAELAIPSSNASMRDIGTVTCKENTP